MKNGIIFPNYTQDIASCKRTLFHSIEDDYKIGEPLCLIGHPGAVRGLAAIVTDVKRMRLADLTIYDEAKLNCSKQDYLARWNAMNPAVDDEVFAVEFRYGFANEARTEAAP